MSYQNFETKWLGKLAETDNYPEGELYQCVDLIKQFIRDEHGVPFGSYGVAVDYWNNTAPAILKKFDKIRFTGDNIKAGDILPLKPVDSKPSHKNGHIAISNGAQTSTRVEVLEQNGSTGSGDGKDGNRIRVRAVPKDRVLGILRAKVKPVPKPKPGGHPLAWTVGKTVRLTGASHRVYPVGSTPPRDGHAYVLKPTKPGVRNHLDYKVLRTDKALNSVVIKTHDKGEQSCPIASDDKGKLYSSVSIK